MAASKKKPAGEPDAPDIARALDRVTAGEFMKHSRWDSVELLEADLALVEALEPRLSGVRLDGGDVGESKLVHLVIEDSEFLRLSAANAKAQAATIRRTRLDAVRMTGVDLTQADIRDVTFSSCGAEFASLNRARVIDVHFVDCVLRDVDFSGAQLERVRFDRCDLSLADFGSARFDRCEMRGCILDGAKGVPSLAGVAMPFEDMVAAAAVFAGALGIAHLTDDVV